MLIEIDKGSGFCFGVVYAIQKAEEELENTEKLYCLGDIVHNNAEVARLKSKGLITINHDEFRKLKNCRVLLRAHGEPSETYKIALENNITLIDASCPVVLKLQNRIKIGYDVTQKKDGQIIIYGKKGHAEVNGLIGQTNNKGIVISDLNDLDKIDYAKPITIFSQTTKSIKGYAEIVEEIKKRMHSENNDISNLISYDTICRQVSNRNIELQKFAKKHKLIIFVSGKKSSNGKMLYEVCKAKNKNTYFVTNSSDLKKEWFENKESIGICGATSTPRWLMEKINNEVFNLFK